MGLDQSEVLALGMLVPKEGGRTLLHNTLLVILPWSRKPPFFVGSPRSLHQGSSQCNTWSTRHTLAGWLQT